MQNKINMKITKSNQKSTPGPIRRVIKSLAHFIKFLETKNLAPDLKQAVLKIAYVYPEAALDYLYINFDYIVQDCAAKLITERPLEKVDVVLQDDPQVFMPPETKIEKVPLPEVIKKSLFDKEVPEVKSKWATTPAHVVQQRQKELREKPQQVQQQNNQDNEMEKIRNMFNKMYEENPPREGRVKE